MGGSKGERLGKGVEPVYRVGGGGLGYRVYRVGSGGFRV